MAKFMVEEGFHGRFQDIIKIMRDFPLSFYQ